MFVVKKLLKQKTVNLLLFVSEKMKNIYGVFLLSFLCINAVQLTGFMIRCSQTAQNLLETFGSFVLIRHDELFIKGKGMCPSYNLCGETGK